MKIRQYLPELSKNKVSFFMDHSVDAVQTLSSWQQFLSSVSVIECSQGRINHCANCSMAWGPRRWGPQTDLIFITQMTSMMRGTISSFITRCFGC